MVGGVAAVVVVAVAAAADGAGTAAVVVAVGKLPTDGEAEEMAVGRTVAVGFEGAAVVRTRHHPQLMGAKQRVSNLCLGSAGALPPRGPAARRTWPSLGAWWSMGRRSRFLI